MEKLNNPTPWLRLPPGEGADGKTETALNYTAFQCYYQLHPRERSLAVVAAQQKKSKRLIEKWSSNFHWRARSNAWDQEGEKQAAEAESKRSREEAAMWAQRKAEHTEEKYHRAHTLLRKGDQMIAWPLGTRQTDGGATTINPAKFTFQTGASFIRYGHVLLAQVFQEVAPETEKREEVWEFEDYSPGGTDE